MERLKELTELAEAGACLAGRFLGPGGARDVETLRRAVRLAALPNLWGEALACIEALVPEGERPAFLEDLTASRRWWAARARLLFVRPQLVGEGGNEEEQEATEAALSDNFAALIDAIGSALWVRSALQRASPRRLE